MDNNKGGIGMTKIKSILVYFLTIFLYGNILKYTSGWLDLTTGNIMVAIAMIILSLAPHIVGMQLAYKYKQIGAWIIILLYWFFASVICRITPYAANLVVPQFNAGWIEFSSWLNISMYVTPFLCALTHLLISVLFLYVLWRKNGKSFVAK